MTSVFLRNDAADDTLHKSRASYDSLARDYDRYWSVHVREPQQRLTRELELGAGLRCADLACGTGVDTLEMLETTAPGEMVAVDCSRKMLEIATQRAQAAGLSLTTRCEGVDDFFEHSAASSFDRVSMRFCLGYLDWRSALQRVARLVRPNGQLGILTILATSAPQAYATYEDMAREFGLPVVARSGPPSLQQIEEQLRGSGFARSTGWTHSFRLAFGSGEQLSSFLQQTGVATHPMLAELDTGVMQALWRRFAVEVESHRSPDGSIPLDFELAGVVAERSGPAL